MISFSGSIVASLENVNGFLAMYTPSDDLIRIDFEQKGVVPEVYKTSIEAGMTKKAMDSLDGGGM
nr:hypothetical protein [Tanacetum cinerariifolium]